MENLNKCPLCEHPRLNFFMECNDLFLTNETFNLTVCEHCQFVFVNPRPEEKELSRYYESPEYISHSSTNRGLVNFIYLAVRKYTIKKKFNIVNRNSCGKSLLDIGCASGDLLNYFKTQNWTTLGIEPNKNARKVAIEKYNLDVKDEPHLDFIENKSFDAISMWHVLEHVSSLQKRMEQITRIIKDDGVIIIALPNRLSFDAEYYKENWAAYDVPRHLYHFSCENIKLLFLKYNFNLISKIPMKFDSYYVSMLSEKYKTGKNSFLKGLYRGMLSNSYARRKSDNYSSLIYIFKKSRRQF